MFEELLKVKDWSAEENGRFFDALNDYFNEDKCQYAADVAKELLNRGGNMNITSAETILLYAVHNYFDVDDKNAKAKVYYRLGELYETIKEDYVKAYTYYEKYVLNNTDNEGTHALMVRIMLLRDDFKYSDELERELLRSYADIDLGLRTDRLYENIANYLTADFNKDEALAEKYKARAKAILKADEIFIPDMFLKRDTIRDVVEVPEKVIAFVNSL